MLDVFFDGPAAWFGFPALLGTLVFLLRLVLMMVGGAHLDFGDDSSAGGFEAHGDPSDGFKIFSIQAAAAFAMGFGWAGLAAYRGSGFSLHGSIVAGVAGGVGMTWMLALLLKAVYSLQSSGNIEATRCVGQQGRVEVLVPGSAKGHGRVTLVLDGRQRSFHAATQGEDLATGTPVLVLAINDDNSLSVARA
ncbi:MAG TPA: hypothetical protein PL072_05135 [Phycisphaerales bacterium]|nr:hypothetical protein [Phycisphaerales bacterium]